MNTEIPTQGADSAFALAARTRVEDLGGGITRQVLAHGPDLMLCRVEFEDGAVGTLHCHPHRQATYVESGRFRASVAGQVADLGPGDSMFVVADAEHGVVCLQAGVLIDVFTPARQDFLKQEDVA